MNGLSTREQKRALHHRTGGAAALAHQSLSTGPGAVYPSQILTLPTTEKLGPILTTDQCFYANITLLLQVNNPSTHLGRRLVSGELTTEACIQKAKHTWTIHLLLHIQIHKYIYACISTLQVMIKLN